MGGSCRPWSGKGTGGVRSQTEVDPIKQKCVCVRRWSYFSTNKKKVRPVLMASLRPHTPLAAIAERLQPQRRDKKEEVGRGQVEGGSRGAAFALWLQYSTSLSWGKTTSPNHKQTWRQKSPTCHCTQLLPRLRCCRLCGHIRTISSNLICTIICNEAVYLSIPFHDSFYSILNSRLTY